MAKNNGSNATKKRTTTEKTEKQPVGRPAAYKTETDMQKVIDEYFKRCEGIRFLDDDGKPVVTKYGFLYEVEPKPPTITGLALALGFNSRTSLLNYEGKEEFVNTITRAKARVEEYAEARLFDKDGANGAKFSLANNFKQWKEKQEVELNGNVIRVELTEE